MQGAPLKSKMRHKYLIYTIAARYIWIVMNVSIYFFRFFLETCKPDVNCWCTTQCCLTKTPQCSPADILLFAVPPIYEKNKVSRILGPRAWWVNLIAKESQPRPSTMMTSLFGEHAQQQWAHWVTAVFIRHYRHSASLLCLLTVQLLRIWRDPTVGSDEGTLLSSSSCWCKIGMMSKIKSLMHLV